MSQQQSIDTTASPVIPPETGLALFDLRVSATPLEITFDADGLNAAIDAVLADYVGLVVTEDMVTGIKSEMAALNKIKERIDAARKQIAAQIGAPLEEFEALVKDAVQRIVVARAQLDAQVKAFEEKERETRRPGVQKIITEALADAGLEDFDVPFDERWLNKSASSKNIRAAVESIVLKEKAARLQAEQLERAKADRIAWVEQAVDHAGKSFGFALPVARFASLFDLAVSMEQAQTHINEAFGQEQAARHRAARPASSPPPTPKATSAPEPMPTVDDDAAMPTAPSEPDRRVMNVQIAYRPSDFHALMRQLEEIRAFALVTIHGNG